MFQNDELQNHLETSSTISQDSAVIAEWNMNIPGNIKQLGNYRYRRNSTQYSVLPDSFDQYDTGNFYTNATDADIVNDYGYDSDDVPLLFKTIKQKDNEGNEVKISLIPLNNNNINTKYTAKGSQGTGAVSKTYASDSNKSSIESIEIGRAHV